QDKWPWLDHTPQQSGWHDSPAHPEQISVAVAEHPTSNIGRSFHRGSQPPPGQTATDQGLYFVEQWQRAREVDPEFVFVTGWNEWIAQRFLNQGQIRMCGRTLEPGETFFVDQYSQEFSRDIEPMQGGHGDAYYYQLVSAVRRFKGVRSLPPVASRPVIIDGRFEDWREVGPEFRDTLGDTTARQHPGWKGEPPFEENSGRNDIVAAKVSADTTHLYFYVRTREALTPCSNSNWMLLFLDTDQNPSTGWLGYDFVLNRSNVRAHTTTLQRHAGGGYHWETVAEVSCQAAGNELEVAIPRAALGLSATVTAFDFKWADNIQQTGEAGDFLLHGDVAPNGRFNFRAKLASESGAQKP
ncbi:MAG TPA: hypothetical protein VNT26_13660, partial [Candidatus Sulfotelmatobacter sp.]|nr:hypothetical protein [Candidatus Sulfotelmatobacter sp.]